ncbi:MAG: ATP-binding protein, partial [Chitinophagia bacterium]|nr:ATP-binding protein [Chitinophagia bacterium]
MELFDLNIETILENWEIYHAIREIISNALDEQTITKTKDVQITHSKKQLIIRDFGRGLHYKNLTQKENPEKLNHPTVIGKFGIGLKDALATFDRNQLEVLIKSKHHDISLCKSPKKGFADVETIHAKINQSTEPNFIGTEVTINGVSEKDLNAAKELFVKFSKSKLIEETKTGQVYKKSDNSNVSIYVNGVKIAEEESFLFSYNIIEKSKALSKALNRERSHVGRDAYTESIKKILLQCKSESLVNDLCKDLENMTNGSNHDELKWIDVQLHVVKIRNNIGNVIFVT